jgi:hypothetical protein
MLCQQQQHTVLLLLLVYQRTYETCLSINARPASILMLLGDKQ